MSSVDKIFSSIDESDLTQRIVEELLNTDENLESKTELNKPIKWSILDNLREYTKDHKLPKSQQILDRFINTSFKFLISHKREGRKEYVEALKSLTSLQYNEEKEVNKLSMIKGR